MKDFKQMAQEAADKIMEAAGKTMDKAKDFVEGKTEIVKVEWELAKKKNMLDAMLYEYGKLCYYADASSTDEKTKCYSAMVEVEAEISMLEAQVAEIKAEEVKKAEEKEAEKNTVFCTNCGKEYKDKEKFCSKCGNKLNK